MVRLILTTVFSLGFLLICAEVPLKAYADPGSGLLLWQIVAAVFVGAVYQARKAFSRIKRK
ncbi:MAG: hypothetical protein ABSH45_00375 [Bryobacteraceae bacterium]|jgi:hypothetical protein